MIAYGTDYPESALPDPDDPDTGPLTVDDWPSIVPLGRPRPVPPFPIAALGDGLGRYVVAVADETQTPVDLPACACLSSMSAALQGRATVQVRVGWSELVVVYIAVGSDSGSRKTAVFRRASDPLWSAESQLEANSRAERLEREFDRKVAEREARQTKDPDAAKAALDSLNTIIVPPVPRILCDDLTPEALAEKLSEHPAIAVMSDEGGGIHTLAGGRYTRQNNLDVILKAHVGSPAKIDRKGSGMRILNRPVVTIGVTVQPSVLRDLISSREFRDRGFVARFAMAIPVETVGTRAFDAPGVDKGLIAKWSNLISTTAVYFAEHVPEPKTLTVTDEALAVLRVRHGVLEPRLGPDGDLRHLGGWGGKAQGLTVRLAALLSIYDRVDLDPNADTIGDSWHESISAEYMVRAGMITDYFTEHMQALFDGVGVDGEIAEARQVWSWLSREGRKDFTQRDVQVGLPRFKHERVAELVEVLVDHGYVRAALDEPRPGPGRKPSPRYEVNPKLIDGWRSGSVDSVDSVDE